MEHRPDSPDRRLFAVVAAAIAVRFAVMWTGLGSLDDPDNYLKLAGSLAEGRGFCLDGYPTANRPPLYPALLAPLTATLGREWLPWGVAALHLALGVGTVLLVHRAARRLGYSAARSLAAAAIVGFDPVLVAQSRSVMTETPAAFLVAATLAALTRTGLAGPILGGFGFGLCTLCRPSLLPGAALTALAGLATGPGSWKTRAGRSALLLAATIATLAPWAWRNARVVGSPVWTTTHGGYTLALANNPVYYADVLDGPPGAVWSGPNQARWFSEMGRSTAGLGEVAADRFCRSEALRMLRERPRTFLRASIARLGRFWGVAPSDAVYPPGIRLATAAWTAPLWLAMAFGLARRPFRAWPGVAAPAIILALTLVHLAFWTDLRMRAPLVPAIALVASGASVRGSGWTSRPGRSHRFSQFLGIGMR